MEATDGGVMANEIGVSMAGVSMDGFVMANEIGILMAAVVGWGAGNQLCLL